MATLSDLMIRVGIDTDRVRKGADKILGPLDKAFGQLDKVAGKAITTMTGLSGVAPLAAGAAGGVVALGASFAAAGAAAGVFGAVLGDTISDVSENATKYEDLTEKIRLYGRQAELAAKFGQEAGKYDDKRNKALLELEARLSLLPPAERAATMEFIEMKNAWADFKDDNKPATFALLSRGYDLIGKTVGKLQPLYDIGARAAGRLIDRMTGLVDGGFIERLVARAGPALDSLTSILLNLGTVFGNVFGKMGDAQGQAMLDWIERLTGKWAAWATSSDQDTGINRFVEYMTTNGPRLVTILGNLATAAGNIALALAPFAPITVAIASALSDLIAAVPPDVITAIVAGFVAWSAALKVYAMYQAIATAAQWAQNAAMFAWPGTWIILGIMALIAVIVLIATKTTWFQDIWESVWNFLKGVGRWFAGPFADFFVNAYNKIINGLTSMKNGAVQRINAVKAIFTSLWNNWRDNVVKILAKAASLVSYFQRMPGRVAGALGRMFSGLWSGFRGAVNRIIGGWNRLQFTIGGGSFAGISIPSVSFGTPDIPYLAQGGIVTDPTLAMIGEGGQDEAVIPLDRMPELAGRDDPQVIVQIVPGGEMEFRRWIRKSFRVKGELA